MKKLLISLILIFPALINAQKLNLDLKSADISTALKLIGLEIFKFDFNSVDYDYNLLIHLEEIAMDSVINQKTYNFGQWQKEIQEKEFKIISNISSDTSEVYWINLIHPNMQLLDRFDISSEFQKVHFWKVIKQGEIIYNQKIPLLFYGMAWEDEINGMKIRRFCWGEEVKRDLKSKELKKVKHMILIRYELVK